MRAMQERISELLVALKYDVVPAANKLVFQDPQTAFPVPMTILCGRIRTVAAEEYTDPSLDVIVVEDGASEQAVGSIAEATAGVERADGRRIVIETETRFVDRLWKADALLGLIDEDARYVAGQIPAEIGGIDLSVDAWYSRHFNRRLTVGGESRPAAVHFDTWLADPQHIVPIIFSEAGTGKTELAGYLSQRSAIAYRNAVRRNDREALPTLVYRIPMAALSGTSVGVVAGYLEQRRLRRVNAGVLHYLLVHKRLALILDGMDEVDAPIDQLKAALSETAHHVGEGAKIAITSRSIAALGAETDVIRTGLGERAVQVTFVGLTREEAVGFLESYGVEPGKARATVDQLPDPYATIPLFLLLGWAADAAKAFGDDAADLRRAELLDALVEMFCEREYQRQGIDVATQRLNLKWIARGEPEDDRPFTKDEALASLRGLEQRIVTHPHGLLTVAPNERGTEEVRFRNDLVRRLFIAQQLHEELSGAMLRSQKALAAFLEADHNLARRRMNTQTLDLLVELLSDNDVRSMCAAAQAGGSFRRHHFLARNLVYLAIEFMEDSGLGRSRDRADYLAELLGTRDLSGSSLAGLVFDNLDFSGWDLSRTRARGARFVGCLLADAKLDASSLIGARFESCDTEPADQDERELMDRGLDKLMRVVALYRIGDSATVKPEILAREADPEVMSVLDSHAFVDARPGPGGGVWKILPRGERAFRRLLTQGSPEPVLEPLLRQLGAIE